jgi:hypothetical protein
MIAYTLACENGHDFEAWFKSSGDYDRQSADRLLECPVCASHAVEKALMAPAIGVAAESTEVVRPAARDAEMRRMMRAFKEHVVANTEDVGERFPQEARRIHYGEAEERGIRGRATPVEARELLDEGITVAPMPVLPEERN